MAGGVQLRPVLSLSLALALLVPVVVVAVAGGSGGDGGGGGVDGVRTGALLQVLQDERQCCDCMHFCYTPAYEAREIVPRIAAALREV